MLRLGFLVAFRNFIKYKTSFLINIIGLTSGMTCAFLISLWVQDEFLIDAFHDKEDRLYQVMAVENYASGTSVSENTPGLLGASLKTDFPDVQYAATTTWIFPTVLSYNNTFIRENGYHVGKDFFNIFTYPLILGNPNNVLNDPSSICISRDVAKKLFSNVENAMGKSIQVGENENFIVNGIFENISNKSTYQFDFVLPLQSFLDQADWANDWANSGPLTFVVLNEGVNAALASDKISAYVKSKVSKSKTELFLKKYAEQYLYGHYANGVPDGGRIDYVWLFSIIAVFILIIACINFMNLSTARASKRAQEVGIRKTIGAGRIGLIGQYIGEALFIAFLSMLIAYGLAALLLTPFNTLTGKAIELTLTPELIAIAVGAALLTGCIAGSYPAFYLTHFRPIAVLKNEIKNSSGELWARRGLVVFQFSITIILIVGVTVIHNQTQYLTNKHLGYDQENIIFFPQEGTISNRSEAFFNALKKIPEVVHAGGTSHDLLGSVSTNPGLDWEGKAAEEHVIFERFFVDYDLYKTMDFQMAEGRWFSREFSTDTTKMVINETAAKIMGFSPKEAIGQRVKLSPDFYLEIVGVLEDFHYQSLHQTVEPAYFRLASTYYIAARLARGKEEKAIAKIEALFEKFAPGYTLNYSYLDQNYQALYSSEKRVGQLSSYFAGFAIIISCLGLFGLAAFTAERRVKEIGIRKVLGASVGTIVILLSKDFVRLVLMSIVIALPLSYLFMQEWLSQFAYKIHLSIWIFIGAAVTSVVIAWLSVSSQALKAAIANPVQSLKTE
ncbi:MAG: ABC transporter permease [Bacteroidota bacterium]